MQKILNPFPSVEYLETFLEYNQMFVIGSSAWTYNSQTIVYFHDHNISLQARHIETPKKNIQFNFKLGGLRSLCSPALYLAESLLALRARRALRAVTTALFGSVARQ